MSRSATSIENTDRGSQFTRDEFTGMLEQRGIRISMHGKGSHNGNLFIERLRRPVKYEEVYLKAYRNDREAQDALVDNFHLYNNVAHLVSSAGRGG